MRRCKIFLEQSIRTFKQHLPQTKYRPKPESLLVSDFIGKYSKILIELFQA